jgi:competence protein ComEA
MGKEQDNGEKTGRLRTGLLLLLMVIIVAGGAAAWSRYEPGRTVEIIETQGQEWDGTVYVGGAVNLPGYYPFTYEDTIESLVRAAGGTADGESPAEITLVLGETGETSQPQKINLNQADAWLLEALPEIGETLAARIIDYRTANGDFNNTRELMLVEGIGPAVYEKIKDLVTVSE